VSSSPLPRRFCNAACAENYPQDAGRDMIADMVSAETRKASSTFCTGSPCDRSVRPPGLTASKVQLPKALFEFSNPIPTSSTRQVQTPSVRHRVCSRNRARLDHQSEVPGWNSCDEQPRHLPKATSSLRHAPAVWRHRGSSASTTWLRANRMASRGLHPTRGGTKTPEARLMKDP